MTEFLDATRRRCSVGGAGNDVLTGGGGADIFAFNLAQGQDTVRDFVYGSDAGHDVVQFAKSTFADFDAVLAHASDSGANLVISEGTQGSVTLLNVHKADLVAGDFRFV